jgi:LysR family transcriptional regulator, cys regulon transcriptional activator
VALKSGVFLRDYVYTFIAMLTPELSETEIRERVENKQEK